MKIILIEMEYMVIMMMVKDLHSLIELYLELIKKIDWQPDVIHCNDWQAG